MKQNYNIRNEIIQSIRYVIPVIFVFIGIVALYNYSDIQKSVMGNLRTITNILMPLFIGFIIAYVLNQPMTLLEARFKLRRPISVALIYITVVIIIIAIWLFLVPNIQSSINELTNNIPQSIEQLNDMVNSINKEFNLNITNENAKNQIDKFITKYVVPYAAVIGTTLGDFIINFLTTLVSYTVNIFLGIVISIYLLLSKEVAIESISILSRKIFGRYYKSLAEFVNVLDKNIGIYIIAKAIDSTIYGIGCVIILSIINSEYALLIGIIAGITNMIPFFGPIIGTIVAVVVNLFFSFDKAILVLMVMIIVQQLESVILEPYFVGKQVGVPPTFTIIAVALAGQYFGFMGILLSVPITGVILMYLNRYIDKERLNNKYQ